MCHAERISYDVFIEQLVHQSTISTAQYCSSSNSSSSNNSSGCSPSQLAAAVYAMAVLGVSSTGLIAAVVQAVSGSLRHAAAEVQVAAEEGGDTVVKQAGTATGKQQQQPAPAVADVCGWGPSEVASLMWGLGTLGSNKPDTQWLEHMTAVTRHLLSR